MQSILEELYSGNIRLDSKIYPPDSQFIKFSHIKNENIDKLMSVMDETQKKLFEKYLDAQAEIEGIVHYDLFVQSFILGSSLMMETLNGREEMIK